MLREDTEKSYLYNFFSVPLCLSGYIALGLHGAGYGSADERAPSYYGNANIDRYSGTHLDGDADPGPFTLGDDDGITSTFHGDADTR